MYSTYASAIKFNQTSRYSINFASRSSRRTCAFREGSRSTTGKAVAPTALCSAYPPPPRLCGRYLVNPSQFSSVGIEDDEFFTDRGKLELRKLFESTGYPFSQEVNNDIYVLNPSTIYFRSCTSLPSTRPQSLESCRARSTTMAP